MEMWIARDKNNQLWLYPQKPIKYLDIWGSSSSIMIKLDEKEFPNITWEDENPTKVSISIV